MSIPSFLVFGVWGNAFNRQEWRSLLGSTPAAMPADVAAVLSACGGLLPACYLTREPSQVVGASVHMYRDRPSTLEY